MAGALVAAGLVDRWPVLVAASPGSASRPALSAAGERVLVAPCGRRVELAAILLLAAGLVVRELLRGLYSRSAYAFPSVGGELHPVGGTLRAADLVTVVAALGIAAAIDVDDPRARSSVPRCAPPPRRRTAPS